MNIEDFMMNAMSSKYGICCPAEELKAKEDADNLYTIDPTKYEEKIKRMTEWLEKKGEENNIGISVNKGKTVPKARMVDADGYDFGDVLSDGTYYNQGVVIDLDNMTEEECTNAFNLLIKEDYDG